MSFAALVDALNALPPVWVLGLELLTCFSALLLAYRLFGRIGLHAYIAVAVIAANVQVLKAVQFGFYAHPVALGTIVFSSIYLATDMLAEQYGAAEARRGVWLGFASYLFWTVLMLLTLGLSPLTPEQAGDAMAWALPVQDHMTALFLPAPIFLVAGLTAYLVSQSADIWMFERLRGVTGGRWLWLRNNGSTLVSGLIDNAVFSVLAWVVLAPEPIGWEPLVFTYILGTYGLRVAIALLDTPFLYGIRLLNLGVADRTAPRHAA